MKILDDSSPITKISDPSALISASTNCSLMFAVVALMLK